jgi:hypothetical protein
MTSVQRAAHSAIHTSHGKGTRDAGVAHRGEYGGDIRVCPTAAQMRARPPHQGRWSRTRRQASSPRLRDSSCSGIGIQQRTSGSRGPYCALGMRITIVIARATHEGG